MLNISLETRRTAYYRLIISLFALTFIWFCGTAQAAPVLSGDAINPRDVLKAGDDEAFNALLNRYHDILTRDGDESPVQLPPREEAQAGENGEVVEVEDPESAELERKLEKIDSVPPIRPIDREALKLAESYDSAKKAPMPHMENGRINFFYGTMNPRIQCRPLRLTDVELEPGEQIKNVHISDSVRWSVSGSWSGAGDSLVTHVILKPQLPDISANLLIHTDRRTYSIDLVSTADGNFMPYVGFIYPELSGQARVANAESWENLNEQYKTIENEKQRVSAENAKLVDPAHIYMDYTIKVTGSKKSVPWKPVSAYDANGKTYIVMPDEMKVTEAPAMYIKQGRRDKLVNYRVDGNIYIVDRLFDTGIMVIGAERVAIIRKTPVGS